MTRSLLAAATLVLATACAHPLDAVQGAYTATLTLTLAGGNAAYRTHTLSGTVAPQTDEGVPGTVTMELSETAGTTVTRCSVVLVGGTTEDAPVEFGSVSCLFPGEKLAQSSDFATSKFTSAAASKPPDFGGGFDLTVAGVYHHWDTVLFTDVRIVNDATVKLTVAPAP